MTKTTTAHHFSCPIEYAEADGWTTCICPLGWPRRVCSKCWVGWTKQHKCKA